jgi:phage gp29-like protein
MRIIKFNNSYNDYVPQMKNSERKSLIDKTLLVRQLETLENEFNGFSIDITDTHARERGYEVYDKTLLDPILRSSIGTIIQAINSMNISYIANNNSEEEIQNITFFMSELFAQDIMQHILFAILYGITYINIVWEQKGKFFIPKYCYLLPHKYFYFKHDKLTQQIILHYYYCANNSFSGKPIPEYSILYPQYDNTYTNPYGTGLLSSLYKLIYLKNNTINFNAMLVEDHGQPKLDITVNKEIVDYVKNNNTNATIDDVLEDVIQRASTVRQNGIFAHLNGIEVTTLESAGTESSTIHQEFIQWCNTEITTLLLGHNGANQSTAGQLGENDTANNILSDRVSAYSSFIADYCNQLIGWYHSINYGDTTSAPTISFKSRHNTQHLTEMSDIVNKLFTCGVTFNKDFFVENFNFNENHFDIISVSPNNLNDNTDVKSNISNIFGYYSNFLAADNDNTDNDTIENFEDLLANNEDYIKSYNKINNYIISVINNYDDYNILIKDLIKIFPKIPIDDLQELILRAMLISRLDGSSVNNISTKELNDLFGKKPDDIIEYFKKLGISPAKDYKEVLKAVQSDSLAVAGVTSLEAIMDIKNLITEAISSGRPIKEFKENLVNDYNINRQWHAELIIRQNISNAYNAGNLDMQLKSIKSIPYITFSLGGRRNHTEGCFYLATHKIAVALNDPLLRKVYPPRHFRCGTRASARTATWIQENEYTVTNVIDINEKYYNEKGFDKLPNVPMLEKINFDNIPGEFVDELMEVIE